MSTTLNPIQRVIVRRKAGQRLAEEARIGLRQAIREIDTVTTNATAAMLAAAVDCDETIFRDGIYAESCVASLIGMAGVAMPVGAIGDGAFLKWLFSDEGREAVLAWIETIVKIVSILAPLFV